MKRHLATFAAAMAAVVLSVPGCGGDSTTRTVTVVAPATTGATTTAAATTAGRSANTPDSPQETVRYITRLLTQEQYGKVYVALDPTIQRLVTPGSFAACWGASGSGNYKVGRMKFLDVSEGVVDLPGEPSASATSVTWRESGTDVDGRPYEKTFTRHVVNRNDEWRYVLGQQLVSELQAGRCPWGGTVMAASGSAAPPALLTKPRKRGEILITGATSPKVFGPYNFRRGGYLFRFEQFDSTNPGLDFSHASSFVVSLETMPNEVSDRYQLLVNTTEATGDNQVTVSGRLYVNVSSADAAYVLRFTPRTSGG